MPEKSASPILAIPRRLGLALFRTHIENGAMVSLGMAFVGLAMGACFGRYIAVLACSGALCASIVDHPGTRRVKAMIFAMAAGFATVLNGLTLLTSGHPALMALLVAAMSFGTGLISAYGRRAIALGVACVLAVIYGLMAPATETLTLFQHGLVFAGGGILYSVFALSLSALLDDRNRRMLLAEALRAFGAYAAAKSELYNPQTRPRLALQSLIEAHSYLIEQLQTSRDMIFTGARTARRMRWMAALLTLLDVFHTILSSDADIEILRQSVDPRLMHRLRALTADIAADAQELALALVTPGVEFVFPGHHVQLEILYDEIKLLENAAAHDKEPLATSAFRSTVHKLDRAISYLTRMTLAASAQAGAEAIMPKVDLNAFIQHETMSPKVLMAQMSLSSPTMRYAIRMSLAMTCGYILTQTVPGVAHSGWVLLTTSLIMRASYSITKRRRNDRVVGTVMGCVVAAILVYLLPRDWLFLPMFFTVGSAHAFAPVYFAVTSLSASVTALLQLYFLMPETQTVFFERIFDTFIGAGLAWLFSFLLPSWEWRNVPRLVNAMVKADREYAALALRRKRNDQAHRLARKRAHDAVANLSSTVRRLVDEPKADNRTLGALNELLIANYMLTTEFASMRVLFRMRTDELDPQASETLLKTARTNVDLTLGAIEGRNEPKGHLSRRSLGDSLGGPDAMVSLRRRLIHIERAAGRVAARASRALEAMKK